MRYDLMDFEWSVIQPLSANTPGPAKGVREQSPWGHPFGPVQAGVGEIRLAVKSTLPHRTPKPSHLAPGSTTRQAPSHRKS
jgi:hypothetical protein